MQQTATLPMKRVLMIAYHFPPLTGTSGVQRALRFCNYLPEYGWETIVLSAHPRAYERCSDDLLKEVAEDTPVIRAQAWDTKKHFSIFGRYPDWLALPDRWHWWRFGAIPAGLYAIRRYRPDVIWSTYPIATAHQIGTRLAKLSGLPFVADFRDPMAQVDYPSDPRVWRSFARIEKETVLTACASTFTTPGAVDLYKSRYPAQEHRFELLENGFDESVLNRTTDNEEPLNNNKFTLLHSGVIYPSERDPTSLFEALSQLKVASPDVFKNLVVRFRAPTHAELLGNMAEKAGVRSVIQIADPVSYGEAALEMQRADGLLILQASNCNSQIPAKFYEYLGANRPILILTDPSGDTAWAARRAGINSIAPLDNADKILAAILDFVSNTSNALPGPESLSSNSRRARTKTLAEILNKQVSI